MASRCKILKLSLLSAGALVAILGIAVVTLLQSDSQRNRFAFLLQGIGGRPVAVPPPAFSGLWRTWYRNGRLASEVTYQQGQRKGPIRTWYPNGQKRLEGTLLKSIPYDDVPGAYSETYDGILKRWYPDGKLQEVANFNNGLLHGKWESWDNYDRGYCKRWEEYYQSGKLHGLWIHWDPPGTRTEVTYSNGVRHGWGKQVSEVTGKTNWVEYRENDQFIPLKE
jgi:antitoxin component YwqK of YwqJK toxin-antitoxin module